MTTNTPDSNGGNANVAAAGRVALVTGANKGVGKETARQLAALGCTVWLGARDGSRGREAEAELRGEGGDVRFVELDVTDPATVEAAAKRIDAEHGRLDILVNNAGIAPAGGWNRPSSTPVDAVRAAHEVNVLGVVTVTNALLPLLRRSPAGRIVNVSSELGSLTLMASPPEAAQGPRPELLAYNSSKAALDMATLLYAHELQDTPIKVNAVSPGYCATDLNDFSGPLSPAEGARVPVRAATLADDGPTGTFLVAEGVHPW
jgi:NAD(P)-dependent dehydrogenase (short-subunit alcohol dehydrogenase family)